MIDMLTMIDFNFVNLIITILLGIVIPLAILVIKLWANVEDFKKFKAIVEARQAKEDEKREEETAIRHRENMDIMIQLNNINNKIENLSKQH